MMTEASLLPKGLLLNPIPIQFTTELLGLGYSHPTLIIIPSYICVQKLQKPSAMCTQNSSTHSHGIPSLMQCARKFRFSPVLDQFIEISTSLIGDKSSWLISKYRQLFDALLFPLLRH